MSNSSKGYLTSDKSAVDNEESSSETNIAAKLRRLRAEEIIMSKGLMRSETKDLQEENTNCSYEIYSKTEKYVRDLKKTFFVINNLFRDVKCRSGEENLEEVDIDDVKKDVKELDSKIITFNNYFISELNSLKTAELEITKQIHDVTSENKSIKRRSSLVFKPNKDYVRSPVKSLITTPAKCLEVQKFQEFMENSPNRYGGWIEYNHCIFIKIWDKYYRQRIEEIDSIEEQHFFPIFLNEVLQKCHGTNKNDVLNHAKWYAQFINLRESQQKAIEKWKSNKRKIHLKQDTKNEKYISWSKEVNTIEDNCVEFLAMPQSDLKRGNETDDQRDEDNNLIKINDNRNLKCNRNRDFYEHPKIPRNRLNYMKPTKQWTYRSVMYTDDDSADQHKNLDDIQKLRNPSWRLGLE